MKLPIGIQDFEKIRMGNYVYVDKTCYLAPLLQGGYYFLARPRRFGKSLTISTLKAAFEGKKELFGGLWLQEQYDFQPYPVIHINFTQLPVQDVSLEVLLLQFLTLESQKHHVAIDTTNSGVAFSSLIAALHQHYQQPVVVLVDEYDKPLVDFLDQPETLSHHQRILRGLYGTLKGSDAHLHMVLLTGVSKFGKLNLFSDLNNLYDISLDPDYSLLCGYSKQELQQHFEPYHQDACKRLNLLPAQYWKELQYWYNGYSWDGKNTLYCPFSLLQFFKNPLFKGYWYETGTPTLLTRRIEQKKIDPLRFEQFYASNEVLTTASVDDLEPIGLMFQTGYLTIRDIRYSPLGAEYTLSYPNHEVKQAFSQNLLSEYIAEAMYGNFLGLTLGHALLAGNWEAFFEEVNTTLARIPYDIFPKQEMYFHSLIHLMLVSTGIPTEAQLHTSIGRMDNVMEYLNKVYIFEYKINSTAKVAIQQIYDKGYAERYSGKDITVIGVNFDSDTKAVSEWWVEPLKRLS